MVWVEFKAFWLRLPPLDDGSVRGGFFDRSNDNIFMNYEHGCRTHLANNGKSSQQEIKSRFAPNNQRF
jgi:hypothetical protein